MAACMHRNLLFWKLKENRNGQKILWRRQAKTQQASLSPRGFRAFVSSKLGFSVYTCVPAHIHAYMLMCTVSLWFWLCACDLCVCCHYTETCCSQKKAAQNYKSEECKEKAGVDWLIEKTPSERNYWALQRWPALCLWWNMCLREIVT